MADKDILRMQEICFVVLRPGINDSIGANRTLSSLRTDVKDLA